MQFSFTTRQIELIQVLHLISFAGPFTVSEAHSLGVSSGTSDVCLSRTPSLPHSLRSDLTHF